MAKHARKRLTRTHKISVAGIAAAGAASLVFTFAPGTTDTSGSRPTVPVTALAWDVPSNVTHVQQASIVRQFAVADQQVKDEQAKARTDTRRTAEVTAQQQAASAKRDAEQKAAQAAKAAAAARQQAARPAPAATAGVTPASATTPTYANNLDGWIKQALVVMAKNGIPGSYNGIYRNIMRESSGNPKAINLWDSNAAKGTPSKGLLQVIQPTFDTYHVPGTSNDIYDPVANICAATNYAWHVYGSIDNVNGPY